MTSTEESSTASMPVLVEEEEITGDIEVLRQKIIEVADFIYHFDIEIQTKRGSIKKQFDQIYILAQKNNLTDDQLRKMIVENFEKQGVDPSTMRKVMPESLKKLEKINKRYLDQTPELIAEQFKKEDDQQDIEVGEPFEADPASTLLPSTEVIPMKEEPKQVLTPIQKLEREIYELKREVTFWKGKAERYTERFTARATLSSTTQQVPVIVQVNALDQIIEHIEIDTGDMRQEYETKPPRPKKV